ncbi:MAG TPA: 3-oxoacyl-ACP reductase FabG [Wenzhouxiangella sp.]
MSKDHSAHRPVALVTGASRGIGCAISNHLDKLGYEVFGTATSAAGAESISQRLGAEHGVVLDVTDPVSIDAAVNSIQERVGWPTVLVNNAGITKDQLLLRQRDEEWQAVIDANLTGAMRVTRAVVKGMLKARFGRLIHISSVVAATGNPGQTNYAAAKAGLEGFSRSLALEIASRNITSNVVAPGFIETDMTASLSDEQKDRLMAGIPANRLGQPEDVAACVAFLAGDGAGYVTGQTLHVNGGMYLT